jgi:uncharacterized oxidoreductase
LDWASSTILITGGSSGIGRALAEGFHSLGAQVIVTGRRKALLEEVAQGRPGMTAAVLDVSDAAQVQAFARRVVQEFPLRPRPPFTPIASRCASR